MRTLKILREKGESTAERKKAVERVREIEERGGKKSEMAGRANVGKSVRAGMRGKEGMEIN